MAELTQAMCDASICGLGQAASNPISTVFKYFDANLIATDLAASAKPVAIAGDTK